jgi:hypothetical protein
LLLGAIWRTSPARHHAKTLCPMLQFMGEALRNSPVNRTPLSRLICTRQVLHPYIYIYIHKHTNICIYIYIHLYVYSYISGRATRRRVSVRGCLPALRLYFSFLVFSAFKSAMVTGFALVWLLACVAPGTMGMKKEDGASSCSAY